MKPDSLLQCSQKPVTGPAQSCHHFHILFHWYILLSSHQCLGLPSSLFTPGFRLKFTFVNPPIHATCPAHLILLNLITYKSRNSSFCSLQPRATSCYVQICYSASLSQTPSICVFSLNVREQVSHPYKTAGKITRRRRSVSFRRRIVVALGTVI